MELSNEEPIEQNVIVEEPEFSKKITGNSLLCLNRLRIIQKAVNDTSHLAGSMSEIGCYKGGASYLIASTDPNRRLFVCDSFEGLPDPTEEDKDVKFYHKRGGFTAQEQDVADLLKEFKKVKIVKGFFPQSSTKEMKNIKYSFIHLDVDFYKSTLESLEFFYPRMKSGGILISDDYKWKATPGVEKAFTEFMKDKPEILVDTGHKSCYFVKI